MTYHFYGSNLRLLSFKQFAVAYENKRKWSRSPVSETKFSVEYFYFFFFLSRSLFELNIIKQVKENAYAEKKKEEQMHLLKFIAQKYDRIV